MFDSRQVPAPRVARWLPAGCVPRLLALGLVVASAAGPVGAGGIKVSGPAIEVDPPRFEFGDLPQEHVEKVVCRITNAGTAPLEIREITSDCGCTVAQIADSSLAPGETVDLSITFSTRHFSGPVIKSVYLTSNDPGSPKTRIALAAFVRAILAVDPDAIDFGKVARGSAPSQTMVLRSAAADTVRILDVTAPEQLFTTDLAREAAGDSVFHRLTVTMKPDAPIGPFSSSARVRTNLPSARQLTLNLSGQVHGFFAAEPGRLALGQVRAGDGRTRALELTAARPGSHRVLGVRASDERLGVALETLEAGRHYRVSATLPADMPPGRFNATLLIETDDPDQPEIRVPVLANVVKRSS